MQNQDYIANLATAVANGISLQDFNNYCQIWDIIPCDMTLKMFLTEQSSEKEGEIVSSSDLPDCFVIKFIDCLGKQQEISEKNESEARKLFNIFTKTLHPELFKQVNGKLEKLA